MVRRTRTDIKVYKEDMKVNNFHFPDVEDPRRLIYEFDKKTNSIFEQTLQLFKEFKGSIQSFKLSQTSSLRKVKI